MDDNVARRPLVHPKGVGDEENARTFADRARRFGLVIWILTEHTFSILLSCGSICLIGEFLKIVSFGQRKILIPFFQQSVGFDDALFLMDFVVVVLFYCIAFREIAQLYAVRFRGLLSIGRRAE